MSKNGARRAGSWSHVPRATAADACDDDGPDEFGYLRADEHGGGEQSLVNSEDSGIAFLCCKCWSRKSRLLAMI